MKTHHLLWFYIVCLSQCLNLVEGGIREYYDAKHALVVKLTNSSEIIKEILPAKDINSPVNVKVRISLRQIAKVDEKNQALRLTVWLRFVWNNPFLQWDPKDYHGIESVHVTNEFFWVPDVALFNEASLEEEIEILYKRLATKLVITHDGNCTWNAPSTLLSNCKIDVSRFPFDQQHCNVSIGSWTYNGYKINMTYLEEYADLKNFIPNGQWDVKSAILKNNVGHYGESRTPYPFVTLNLKIKRRSLYYDLNLVVPSALIALLALMAFILPSDHGERISLVITVLLANSVYMLIVSDSLPETSDGVPVLSAFCLGIIVTIALCLFATCLTIKVREMTSPMPAWVELWVIERIARLVCVNFVEENLHKGRSDSKVSVGINEEYSKTWDDSSTAVNEGEELNSEAISLMEMKKKQAKGFQERLLEEVRLLTEELRCKQEEETNSNKWKKVAQILDRFFLFIFSIVYICLITFLLASM